MVANSHALSGKNAGVITLLSFHEIATFTLLHPQSSGIHASGKLEYLKAILLFSFRDASLQNSTL